MVKKIRCRQILRADMKIELFGSRRHFYLYVMFLTKSQKFRVNLLTLRHWGRGKKCNMELFSLGLNSSLQFKTWPKANTIFTVVSTHPGRLFFLNFLWTMVEFTRFPVIFLGYRAYFTFKKFHILVEKYDLPDYGA